jgi:hypothetical protein
MISTNKLTVWGAGDPNFSLIHIPLPQWSSRSLITGTMYGRSISPDSSQSLKISTILRFLSMQHRYPHVVLNTIAIRILSPKIYEITFARMFRLTEIMGFSALHTKIRALSVSVFTRYVSADMRIQSWVILGYIRASTLLVGEKFDRLVTECSSSIQRGWLGHCSPIGFMEIETLGEVDVSEKIVGQGLSSKTFDGGPVVVKIVKNEKWDICKDKAALEVFDSLGGFAPRVFGLVSNRFPSQCLPYLMVIEKVGDADWGDIVVAENRDLYVRLAKLMEAFKKLHFMGFSHGDVTPRNIRVDGRDPNKVWLIDFELAKSLEDMDAAYSDLSKMATMLKYHVQGNLDWLPTFKKEMGLHASTVTAPNYDFWINFFTGLAAWEDRVREQEVGERIDEYDRLVVDCEAKAQRAFVTDPISECWPRNEIKFASSSGDKTVMFRVQDFSEIGDPVGVFKSRFGFKVLISKTRSISLCGQKAALSVLNGLDGMTSRLIEPLYPVKPETCGPFTLFVRQVDYPGWESVLWNDRRAARLLELIKTVHGLGFAVNNVADYGTFGVSTLVPAHIYLVNPISLSPLRKNVELITKDLQDFTTLVSRGAGLRTAEWLPAFRSDMASVSAGNGFNYDKWIQFLSHIR